MAAGAPATSSSDLYGLGVVLFELLTGRRPALRGADDAVPSPRTLRPDIPEELESITVMATVGSVQIESPVLSSNQ